MSKENPTVSKMETPTLTEQWRNGTLPEGMYYVSLHNGDEISFIWLDKIKHSVYFEVYKEVLAPVPTYAEFKDLMSNLQYVDKCRKLTEKADHFSQMEKNVEQLEKKLDIAVKVLEEYAKGDSDAGNGCLYEMPAPSLAQQALKEIDLVGTSMSLAKDV